MGGLIGGEAKKLETHYNKKKNIITPLKERL